MIKETTVHHE